MAMSDDAVSLPSNEESPVDLPSDGEDQQEIQVAARPADVRPRHDHGNVPVDFMEVFSPPRIAPHVERRGGSTGPSIDILTGYDLLTASGQRSCLELIHALMPAVLMLSPPCTVLSQLQWTNEGRRKDRAAWQVAYDNGLKLWMFALYLFEIQVRAGRRAVLEHPSQATSWSLPATRRLLQSNMAINLYIFDQCLLGLRTAVQGDPMRKRTKFMSNLPGLPAQGFNTRCTAETCNHIPRVHVWCQGKEGSMSRARAAQIYPAQFCEAMARAVAAHIGQPVAAITPAHNDDESDIELPSD